MNFDRSKRLFEEGQKNAKQLLKDHDDVDGIFINTDLIAIGAINEFRKQGVRIPEDISIVGFSNWFMSSVTSPSLTTINQPGFEMGQKTFHQFHAEIKAIKDKNPIPPRTITLETDLVKRESTKSF